jgi:putative sigma-54 modulation protein
MHISIDGHHVEVTAALHDYIRGKLARIERHFDHVVDVHVVLAVEKQRHRAEATVHVAGNNIHAHSEDDDMYAAIDALLDKLDRQVKKHKEKLTNHRA